MSMTQKTLDKRCWLVYNIRVVTTKRTLGRIRVMGECLEHSLAQQVPFKEGKSMNTPSVKLSKLAEHFKITQAEAHAAILKHGNLIRLKLLCDIDNAVSVSEETFNETMETDQRLLDMVFQKEGVKIYSPLNISPDRNPRVYFLLSDEEIMYIGQSKDLQGRIATHRRDKEFNGVVSFKVYKEDLTVAEVVNIRHYKPPLNQYIMTNERYFREVLQNSFMVN